MKGMEATRLRRGWARWMAGGVALSAAFAGVSASAQAQKLKLQAKETSLGSISQSFVPGSLVVSPDSRRVLYRAKKGSQEVRVLDGKEGPLCEAIGGVLFSPDSAHSAYVVRAGMKLRVIVDGEEEKQYDALAGMPIFHPSSKYVAYGAQDGKKWKMVVKEKESKGYEKVGLPVFSPDGDRKSVV